MRLSDCGLQKDHGKNKFSRDVTNKEYIFSLIIQNYPNQDKTVLKRHANRGVGQVMEG